MSITLGVVVGLVLGLTGAGGSVLAVPLLMWGIGMTITQAVPVALLAVFASASFGTVVAWNVTYIRYRAAMLMAALTLVTAPIGLKVAGMLPLPALEVLFAGVLVSVAARMFVQAMRTPAETAVVRAAVSGDGGDPRGPGCRLNPATGRLVWTRACFVTISLMGAVAGFLSGLLGVGGGFVIVPAMRHFTGVSIQSAVATSLMAIALISAVTVAVILASGRELPWMVALPFVGGAFAGMLAGRKLAPRIAGPRLQQIFAACMVIIAVLMTVSSGR